MRRFALAVGCLLALLLAAAPAQASVRDKIIKDCADDSVLQGSYTPQQLRDARQNLPSDVAEYTDCADVLRRAELPDRNTPGGGGTTGGGITGGGTGSGGATGTPGASGGDSGRLITPTTDPDRQALIDAAQAGAQPVTVGGKELRAGASSIDASAIRNDLPTPLLVALIALGVVGVALVLPLVRRPGRLPRLPRIPGVSRS
jgi:hypothetical protein